MVQPVANSYSRHSGESRNPGFPVKTGIQSLKMVPPVEPGDDVWIPEPAPYLIRGRVSLARNDDPIPENVKLCESPGIAGGLPNCI